MTTEQLDEQVEKLKDYLKRSNNMGCDFWFQSKGFSKEEKDYIYSGIDMKGIRSG